MHQNNKLSLIVFDKSPARAQAISDAATKDQWATVLHVDDVSELLHIVETTEPDVVVIALEAPRADRIKALAAVSGAKQRPVAMFVDRSEPALIHTAVNAGVSAYVVDGFVPDRLRPVLEASMARYRLSAKMTAELETAKADLAHRKTIDRAKGLLIQAKGLSEEEAYQLLRRTAMDQGKRVSDVAQGLISASKLLG